MKLNVAAWLLLACNVALAASDLDAAFPQSSVVIESSALGCYHFGVHVAVNDAERQRGLMHVRSMPEWRGMLFVYQSDSTHSMWMKNTFIPLDMLFVRSDGSIARIARDTEPQSLRSVSSGEAVRYVLELNAGISQRLGIVAGDRLTWSGDLRGGPSEN